jgi:hypothetical protein
VAIGADKVAARREYHRRDNAWKVDHGIFLKPADLHGTFYAPIHGSVYGSAYGIN